MVFNFIQAFMTQIPPGLVVVFEIGIIIVIATFLAFLVRLFKQPFIPAYIITGILIGPLFLGLIKNPELINALSEIGVAFLIFTAGLEIKFSKLKEIGKVSTISGILQITSLFLIGYFAAIWMGFAGYAPVYVALAVTFSSTMIVVKLLADKGEINSLHGRIIIGILLIQDIAAIIALAVLSSDLSLNNILIVLGKAAIFVLLTMILSKAINPIFRNTADNQELFLLVAISFLFLFVIGSLIANLSLIIGAFFAGVALANSNYKTELQGRIVPLREFFAVIFFVALGMQLRMISQEFVWLILVLLVIVLVVKPFVIMFLVRIIGYKKVTAFLTGNGLAQTSEFSLIIVTLGFILGHISSGLFSSLVLITIITMSFTTYFIVYSKKFYQWFSWPLDLLSEVKTRKEELEYIEKRKKIILFGCHRMGSLFLKEFARHKKDILVVDYNPEIIETLIGKKISCIYGDFINKEVLEKANLRHAEVIISTVTDVDDNLVLIKEVKKVNENARILIVARRISEAFQLYDAGADYVILPQIIGGQKGFDLLKKKKSTLKKISEEHKKYLKKIHHILY
jgi:Kef-type K+ transport system membrane component KefB